MCFTFCGICVAFLNVANECRGTISSRPSVWHDELWPGLVQKMRSERSTQNSTEINSDSPNSSNSPNSHVELSTHCQSIVKWLWRHICRITMYTKCSIEVPWWHLRVVGLSEHFLMLSIFVLHEVVQSLVGCSLPRLAESFKLAQHVSIVCQTHWSKAFSPGNSAELSDRFIHLYIYIYVYIYMLYVSIYLSLSLSLSSVSDCSLLTRSQVFHLTNSFLILR